MSPYLAAASSVCSGSQTAPPLCLRARLYDDTLTAGACYEIVSGIYLRNGNVLTSVPRCVLMRCAMPDNFEFESYFFSIIVSMDFYSRLLY